MGKVFYDNWFAKLILFQGYGTIMFLGMILTKAKEGRLSKRQLIMRQFINISILNVC